jgi:hypothetical protein
VSDYNLHWLGAAIIRCTGNVWRQKYQRTVPPNPVTKDKDQLEPQNSGQRKPPYTIHLGKTVCNQFYESQNREADVLIGALLSNGF